MILTTDSSAIAATSHMRIQQVTALLCVLALFLLNTVRVNRAPVIGADKWTVGLCVELRVRLPRHDRIEKHETAAITADRRRRVTITIAVHEHGERRPPA